MRTLRGQPWRERVARAERELRQVELRIRQRPQPTGQREPRARRVLGIHTTARSLRVEPGRQRRVREGQRCPAVLAQVHGRRVRVRHVDHRQPGRAAKRIGPMFFLTPSWNGFFKNVY